MSMKSQDALRFLQDLTRLNAKYKAIGRSFGIMFLLLGVYFINRYVMDNQDVILPSLIFLFSLYNAFLLEWLSMRFRCVNCHKRFFGAFKPIFPVHERENCHHCGISLAEMEDAAEIKLDIVER